MMRKNKAQINQVFVWIVVALVIGATALFGVRSIGGLLNDKCSIDLVKFEEDLRDTTTLNNDFGSVHLEVFSAPCDYTTVCLVDARAITDAQSYLQTSDQVSPSIILIDENSITALNQQIQPFLPLIQNSVREGVPENIFLFNDEGFDPAGYVPQIRLGEDEAQARATFSNEGYPILCIQAKAGRFSTVMQGLGRNTWIKPEQ